MTITVDAVLNVARAQIGTMERTGRNDVLYADRWGITGYSWCYAFVQWVFEQAGERLPFLTMYVPAGVQWSRDNGQSVEKDRAPQPGDIVHFTWGDGWGVWTPGTGDHVGIVESYEGGDTIVCIEGNVGSPQGVYRLRRSINAVVINYWRPTFYSGTGGGGTVTPPPPEEDEDVGIQIGSDPNQGGNGSVYAVFGCEAWGFTSDESRQLYEQFGLVKPGIKWMHPANINRLVIMRGVIDPSTYNVQNPMPMNDDAMNAVGGAVNAGRSEAGQHAQNVVNAVNPHTTNEANATRANSNKLAASIPASGGVVEKPVLDVAASLKVASITDLLNEVAARTKGNAAV